MISTSSKSILTNSNKNHNESSSSINSINETSNSTVANQRKSNQNINATIRTPPPTSAPPPPQINIKPDRRKDLKLTNCQEKDGIWTATGQFGRESRHSKRAEISYDKKKFRFIQKDEQGSKHVFEIAVADIEGRKFRRIHFYNNKISFFQLVEIKQQMVQIILHLLIVYQVHHHHKLLFIKN